MRHLRWTKESIELALKQWAQEHQGFGPRYDDCERDKRLPSPITIRSNFGHSLGKVCQLLNLSQRPKNSRRTKIDEDLFIQIFPNSSRKEMARKFRIPVSTVDKVKGRIERARDIHLTKSHEHRKKYSAISAKARFIAQGLTFVSDHEVKEFSRLYTAGHTYAEIASITGRSTGAIKRHHRNTQSRPRRLILDGIRYDNLDELCVAALLKSADYVWSRDFFILYPWLGKTKQYYPDFCVKTGKVIVLEVKSSYTIRLNPKLHRAKIRATREAIKSGLISEFHLLGTLTEKQSTPSRLARLDFYSTQLQDIFCDQVFTKNSTIRKSLVVLGTIEINPRRHPGERISEEWPQWKIDFIKSKYSEHSNELLAQRLGCSIGSITARASKLGLSKKGRHITENCRKSKWLIKRFELKQKRKGSTLITIAAVLKKLEVDWPTFKTLIERNPNELRPSCYFRDEYGTPRALFLESKSERYKKAQLIKKPPSAFGLYGIATHFDIPYSALKRIESCLQKSRYFVGRLRGKGINLYRMPSQNWILDQLEITHLRAPPHTLHLRDVAGAIGKSYAFVQKQYSKSNLRPDGFFINSKGSARSPFFYASTIRKFRFSR